MQKVTDDPRHLTYVKRLVPDSNEEEVEIGSIREILERAAQ